jgi:hypothetical protein
MSPSTTPSGYGRECTGPVGGYGFRHSSICGDFVGSYPQNVSTAAALATTLGYAGGTMTYATGLSAGQPVNGYAGKWIFSM